MDRRELLRLGMAAVAGLAAKARAQPAFVPVPRVNGGINLQPLRRLDAGAGLAPPLIIPELVDAQMRTLYELGFEQVRLTLSFGRFGPDFVAGIPYVRAARALGMDVLGVITQFAGYDLVQALSRPESRDEVLETYLRIFGAPVLPASPGIVPGGFSVQVLNEPTHFLGIPPDAYVRDFLRPAYYHVKEDDPLVTIVSAATIGSAEGLLRARRMIDTGLELWCDCVALHVYGTRFLRELAALTDKPVWITESGVGEIGRHRSWMTEVFERIRVEIPAAERIFWFHLYGLGSDPFRLIDLERNIDGSFAAIDESLEAVTLLRERVAAALGESAPLAYRALVPDIMLYFPTEEDFRIIRSTSVGSATWPS